MYGKINFNKINKFFNKEPYYDRSNCDINYLIKPCPNDPEKQIIIYYHPCFDEYNSIILKQLNEYNIDLEYFVKFIKEINDENIRLEEDFLYLHNNNLQIDEEVYLIKKCEMIFVTNEYIIDSFQVKTFNKLKNILNR